MFGRVVGTAYKDSGGHKDFHFEGAVSSEWLAELDAGVHHRNDHKQAPLVAAGGKLEGLTLVVTSLGVDSRKRSRCDALLRLLEQARPPRRPPPPRDGRV